MAALLEVRGLTKRYGDTTALQDLSLDVGRGEVVGLLGTNGAGKTTFTKCVTGFVRFQEGTVRLGGVDVVADTTAAVRHVGLVPDQYDFYRTMTGRQHLDFYGRLFGLDAAARDERIEAVVEKVSARPFIDRRTHVYSHGMKQRLCIAQALLHNPPLLLFDEPTNGLDPRGAYELRELVKELAKAGHAIVLNSHLMHEVQATCRRVAILQQGRLLHVGMVSDLRAAGATTVTIRVRGLTANVEKAVAAAVGAKVQSHNDTLRFEGGDDLAAAAVQAIVAAGGQVLGVDTQEQDLEQAFLRITGDQ